jgi:hypothetical protein
MARRLWISGSWAAAMSSASATTSGSSADPRAVSAISTACSWWGTMPWAKVMSTSLCSASTSSTASAPAPGPASSDPQAVTARVAASVMTSARRRTTGERRRARREELMAPG